MKKRKWRKRLLAICVSSLLAVIAMEGVLRLIGFSSPVFYAPDDILSARFLPGQEGWYTWEGRAYVKINRHGWRDREREKAKPAGVYRITVLGDSYAEALQVSLEQTFWATLEDRLNDTGGLDGKTVEVLNFGRSGYGTCQEYLALHHYVWEYQPDAVLLAFLPANDVSNNSRPLSRNQCRPFFTLQDGQLVLDDSFLDSDQYRFRRSWRGRALMTMLNYSRVAQLVHRTYRIVRQTQMEDLADPVSEQFGERGLQVQSYAPPTEPDWQEAWLVTDAILLKMAQECRERDVTFLVATLTSGLQVAPDPERREAFLRWANLDDMLYPDRRIEALGRASGFDTLSLAPSFRAHATENGVHLHGFGERQDMGHWNERGHRLAGELLAEWTRQTLTARRSRSPETAPVATQSD